jgi:hypothetical protein
MAAMARASRSQTDDAKALFGWFAEWNEFMDIEATPLVEDADAGAVLQSLYGAEKR